MNKRTTTLLAGGLSFSLLGFLGAASVAFAQSASDYVPLTTVPGLFTAGRATNPVTVIKGLYGLAIGAGAVIAVVMIIVAGFKYMYEESISGKSNAKDQITNPFLGLFVILGSYILLRTINADLVNFNPSLPGGTGKVSGLVANVKAAEAYNKALADRVAQMVANQKTTDNLKADLVNKDAVISQIKTQIEVAQKLVADSERTDIFTGSNTAAVNRAQLVALQAQLATATADRQSTQQKIQISEVQTSSQRMDTLTNESRDQVAANEAAKFSPDYRGSEAGTQTRDKAFDAIKLSIARSNDSLTTMVKDININPTDSADVKAAKTAALTKASQDFEYMTAAKDLAATAQGTFTAGRNGVLGTSVTTEKYMTTFYISSYNGGTVSAKRDAAVAKFKAEGRTDLAAQIEQDYSNLEKVVVASFAEQCKDKKYASQYVCK